MSEHDASLQTTAPLPMGMQGPGTPSTQAPIDPSTVLESLENFAVSYTTYQNKTLMAGFMAWARGQDMTHQLHDDWITAYDAFAIAPVDVGSTGSVADPTAARGRGPLTAATAGPRLVIPLSPSARVTGPSRLRR